MPRAARIVIPGVPHHITQRGNNRQDVFFRDEDRKAYLEILKKQSNKYGMEVQGYCLMTNHVHLIARPDKEESLAQAFGRANFTYTLYFNDRYDRSGHLWQNRYFSCALDSDHFWHALCYLERNPVRAGLVSEAWQYRWSSAAAHVGEVDVSGLVNIEEWNEMSTDIDWRSSLSRAEDKQIAKSLQLSTSRGRPLGDIDFITELENRIGRRLRPLPRGRPLKKK